MVMLNGPDTRPPVRLEPRPTGPNPLLSTIIAAVVLCSILTTTFTAGRLFTKRFISKYEFEDCECRYFTMNRNGLILMNFVDMLLVVWVSTRSTTSFVFPKKSIINAKQVASIVFSSVLLAAGRNGLGHHVWDLRGTQHIDLDQVSRC